MLVARWPQEFLARMGGGLPRDYLCLDLETTGFSRQRDIIWEYGHVLVREGRPTDKLNVVINWLGSGLVPDSFVRESIKRVQRNMSRAGKPCRVTEQVMQHEGLPPDEALPFIYEMLRQVQTNREVTVMHNGLAYDSQILLAHFNDFGVGEFRWGDDDILDSLALVKVMQLHQNPQSWPRPNETLRAFCRRLVYWRVPGQGCRLDGPEVASLRLEEFGVERRQLHSAMMDALAAHGIVERLRNWQAGHYPRASSAPSSLAPPRTSQLIELEDALTAPSTFRQARRIGPTRYRGQRNR